MDAIRELQRKLQAAQKISNVRKISEKNCVDLVQKLIELEHVMLYRNSNGKEWITPEHLDQEIRDAIAANGGRITLTELPNELGVAIEFCESRANVLCKGNSGLSKIHGEILSSQYVQGVVQEIEETLEEEGCIAVSDLATRHNLPAEFLRESVIARLSTNHTVKQNSIYTGAYATRVEARVRGAVRGYREPVALALLASRHGISDVDQVEKLIQRMLRDGVVEGRLQGATFTPKVYSDGQASRLDQFFAANKYLTVSLAKASGNSPEDWARAKSVDGLMLKTAFVASELVDSALASISEAVISDSWVDADPLLPPALTIADACELLQHFASQKLLAASAVVIDRVVVGGAYIKDIANHFTAEVKAAAEQKLAAPAGASKLAAAHEEDGGGGKKKAKRVTKGKKTRGDDDDLCEASGCVGSAASGIENSVITEYLAEHHPDLPADIYDQFCAHVQPVLGAMVAEESKAMQATLQVKRKSHFDLAEKLVQERYERLVFGIRALKAANLEETPLSQHLLRETVTDPLHSLLTLRWEELSGSVVEVSASNRRQWLDKIVAKEGAAKAESLTNLLSTLSLGKGSKDQKDAKAEVAKGDKSLKDKQDKSKKKKARDMEDEQDDDVKDGQADVAELYQAAASDCHIFCRKIDKKREKAAIQEQRVACRERLKDETIRNEALSLINGAVVQQSEGVDGGNTSTIGGPAALGDAIAVEVAAIAWREKFISGAFGK
eukprot:TRINITY_DN35957_c0_g1_i1.p1 TRINITY_DN35957_c0_g1~~TRINITY_DN35957_c0_g1_i1.p1  ORF type:complete len:727 (-),score=177.90 TRINITY_DN35957_c0_g1_i1:84-2264(-)